MKPKSNVHQLKTVKYDVQPKFKLGQTVYHPYLMGNIIKFNEFIIDSIRIDSDESDEIGYSSKSIPVYIDEECLYPSVKEALIFLKKQIDEMME